MLTFVRTCNTSACYVTSWVGWGGVGMLTFVRTCNTSACYVTSWVGWGGVGMLTFVRTCNTSACYVTSWVGWGGVGMLTFVRTCNTSACYVTSWVGWGGCGFYPAGMINIYIYIDIIYIFLFFQDITHIVVFVFTAWATICDPLRSISCTYLRQWSIDMCKAITNQSSTLDHWWSTLLQIFECQIWLATWSM